MNKQSQMIGISLMTLAMAFFATKDGFAKVVVGHISPVQLIWLQYIVTFAVLALITARNHGWRSFLPTPFWPQLLRGIFSVAGVGSFYWALVYIPLADASAMILVAPLIVTGLSPFVLGEKIGIRRIVAVIIGFIGVLFVLQPGFRGDIQGYVIALCTGILYGLTYTTSRLVGHYHPPLVNAAHSVIFGAVLLAPAMSIFWTNPPASQTFALSGFLFIAIWGQTLMVMAFTYGQASVVAPFQYTVIVFATAIGYYYFGTFPDTLTWFGIVLIIAAGLFIALRERFISQKMQPASK